jgi:hypothetical protein
MQVVSNQYHQARNDAVNSKSVTAFFIRCHIQGGNQIFYLRWQHDFGDGESTLLFCRQAICTLPGHRHYRQERTGSGHQNRHPEWCWSRSSRRKA